MNKADRIFIAAVIACGLVLATLKAGTAPITTDEAWNYNQWISGGFKTILTDYSAFNNHILQTALSRGSILVLGDNVFAQRFPSIIAYLLFAFIFIKIVEVSISHRILRLLCFSAVLLHPYILDFAALARGYMILLAMSAASIYFIIEMLDPAKPKRLNFYLLMASYTAGLAISTIPSALRLLPGFLLILLIQPLTRPRITLKPLHLIMLLVPAVIIASSFYLPALQSAKNLSIQLGTSSMLESLQSLRMLFFYIPTSVLTAGGNPAVAPEQLLFWGGRPEMQWIHAILAGKTVLCGLAVALIALVILPFKYRPGRAAFSLHIVWVTALGIILMERFVCGSRLPLSRAWLGIVPFPAISAFALIERLTTSLSAQRKRQAVMLISTLALFVMVVRIESFNVLTYWEWPDNHATPDVVSDLAATIPPGRNTSVACPDYLHACLTYYAKRTGLKELNVFRPADAPAEYHLYREDLLPQPIHSGLIIKRYPNTNLILTRAPSTLISDQ